VSEREDALVRWFEDLRSDDVASVGGKNASLGEMIATLKEQGVRAPDGFAVTSEAYWLFLRESDLEGPIRETLESLRQEETTLAKAGSSIRRRIKRASMPEPLERAIREAYERLGERLGEPEPSVAARSSATAEDLPEASFAGQQETYLNVAGADEAVDACRKCFASLFTNRAIAYRERNGFDHMQIALSVGVQKMVRADVGGAGVMFTIDTETGFPGAIVINAAWGLGENVVKGTVTPDEYRVFKPLLGDRSKRPIVSKRLGDKAKRMIYAESGTKNTPTKKKERARFVLDDEQILTLARWGRVIEEHYERPMDIEWALDGETNDLFIVQARPETVHSQRAAAALKRHRLRESGRTLATGLAIGDAIATGKARRIDEPSQGETFQKGEVLVTEMTDPDWGPIMQRAAAIVTDHGGRTSHAAIVSREMGVPAVVGAGDATESIEDGQEVTVDCAEGESGRVLEGALEFDVEEIDLDEIPKTKTQIMMNVASPAAAERWWRLPVEGVGLARIEFIINNEVGVHPLALTRFDSLERKGVRRRIERMTRGYEDKTEFFVSKLAQGVARIAAAQHPSDVIVRMSDFKTNEYAALLGGKAFEPKEENPMLGFRGASRYYSEAYADGFALECRAIRRVREEIGLENVVVMIPFCRTLEEADRVRGVMAEQGLVRGERGLRVYVMAEIPSNVALATEFADRFDGFSIGSNDLTQLVLGVDRDSDLLSHVFDERNEAVKRTIRDLIERAHEKGRKVGICGQGPSDHPDFAAFLVEAGIDSISVNPDSVLSVARSVAHAEESI